MNRPVTIIRPNHGWLKINFAELWRYRELFYIFAWRDLRVRYKQTAIGIVWAILQPFLLMVVFSVFFGNLAGIPSEGAPYPVFVFSGLLFWNYFSISLTNASNSLIDNENIIKKIYFPRVILPLSPAITPVVDFGLSFIVLLGVMAYYHFWPSIMGLLVVPILLLLSFLAATGLGLLLSAINVRYRDIRYALPFFIQSLFFLTPVIYPVAIIPDRYQWILALNPMTGVISTARALLLELQAVNYELLGISALIIIPMFLFGLFYFRRTERVFADIA